MLFYSFIWLILLIVSFAKPQKNFVYYLSVLFLVLLAGLRDVTIGTDTPTYYDIYRWISDNDSTYVEPGWYFLNKLIIGVGGDFTTLLLVTSILTFIPLIYVSNHHLEYRNKILFLFYSMFFYLNTFNGMRQYLAVSIGLMVFDLYRQKKVLWSLLLTALAITIHFSAVFLLLIYIVKVVNWNTTKLFVTLLMSFVIGCVADDSFFLMFLGKYVNQFEKYGYRGSSFIVYFLTIVMNFLTIFVHKTKSKNIDEFWFKVFVIGIILLNLTFRLELGARLILYFTIAQIVFFPMYMAKQSRIINFLVLIYFAMLFFRNFIGEETGGDIIPYKSVLF